MFPVYAGVILLATALMHDDTSVPRVCGGDPKQKVWLLPMKACVPRVCGGDPVPQPDVMAVIVCSPCMRG